MSEATQDSGEVVPKIFGPYLVHERLGVGGMATVHRAVQTIGDNERPADRGETIVALKRLLPHLAEDEAFVKAFVQEAKLSALLKHPNICALHELGRVADTYFMAMEYINGRDIRKCLRQARRAAGPPPLTMVLSVARQICDALDYAHKLADAKGRQLGLVHRDISPSNLLISKDGNVKIIDFGIAKATAQSSTRTGTIKGKLAYMSPEALAGDPDPRSDLFSVGVVLHELLTARPLFADKNDFKVIRKIETLVPPPPSRFNAKCPREMDAFVLKALEKQRQERWLSGRAMVDALDEICHEYKLHPSARDVTEWMSWAFSLPVPERKNPIHESPESSSQVSITFVSESHSAPKNTTEQPGVVESFLAGAPGEVIERAPETALTGPPIGLPPDEDDVLSEALWGDGHLEPSPDVELDDVPDVSAPAPAQQEDDDKATVLYDKPEGGLSVQTQAMLSKLAPAPTITSKTADDQNPAELGFLSFKSPSSGTQRRADTVSRLFTQQGPGEATARPPSQDQTHRPPADPDESPHSRARARARGADSADPIGPTAGTGTGTNELAMLPLAHADTPHVGHPALPPQPDPPRENYPSWPPPPNAPPGLPLPYAETARVGQPMPPYAQQPPYASYGADQMQPFEQPSSRIGIGTIVIYTVLVAAAVGLGIAIATAL